MRRTVVHVFTMVLCWSSVYKIELTKAGENTPLNSTIKIDEQEDHDDCICPITKNSFETTTSESSTIVSITPTVTITNDLTTLSQIANVETLLDNETRSTTDVTTATSFGISSRPPIIQSGNLTNYNMSMQYDAIDFDDIQLVCISDNQYSSLENRLDQITMRIKNGERLPTSVYVENVPSDQYRGYSVIMKKVVEHVQFGTTDKMPIWFVFDGIGSQWIGMADDLMKIPVCNKTMHKLHDTLANEGYDFLGTIITTNMSVYDSVINVFTGITAVQIALIDFLHSINIYPNGMIGHAIGEISCAYADGALTAEEAILTSYFRGRSLVETELSGGSMAIVGLSPERLQRKIPRDKTIRIACHNGQDSTIISGLTNDVNIFVGQMKANKVYAREFKCNGIPFHTEYINNTGSVYLKYLQKVIKTPKFRSERWISSSAEKARWNSPSVKYCSPEYFVNNLLHPVLFYEASMYIPNKSITLEIGPHNVLQTTLRRTLPRKAVVLSLLRKVNTRNLAFLMSSIGRLYISGGNFKAT